MQTLLRLSTLALALILTTGSALAQPDRNGSPAVSLSSSGDAVSSAVQAGGSDRVAVQGSGCSGYIANATPTASIAWSGSGALSIYATSGGDATIVIADPDGRWHCSDDADRSNANPAVTFASAKSGTYLVWVGMIDAGKASATLKAKGGQPAW